ncbi:MAG: hypothetical protein ABSE49_34280 [Polyangiaceae bacterium]
MVSYATHVPASASGSTKVQDLAYWLREHGPLAYSPGGCSELGDGQAGSPAEPPLYSTHTG